MLKKAVLVVVVLALSLGALFVAADWLTGTPIVYVKTSNGEIMEAKSFKGLDTEVWHSKEWATTHRHECDEIPVGNGYTTHASKWVD
jgi:hypothetical protein